MRTEQRRRSWYQQQAADHSNLKANFGESTIPGTHTIEATISFMPNPIGILWYHWTGVRSVEILNCYVPQTYRRCGVMSYLLRKLLAANRNIRKVTTADATKESAPWLKRMGFRQADADDDWTLKVKKCT